MSVIPFIDSIEFLSAIALITIFPRGWKNVLPKDTRMMFGAIVLFIFFHGLSNILEYSGITVALDVVEDYAEILLPFLWGLLFYTFLQDMSDRDIKASKEKFQNLVETTSDMVWEVDRRGVYKYVSPRVESFLGYRPDEVIGRPVFDFMTPEEGKRVGQLLREAVRDKKPLIRLESTHISNKGRRVILETSGLPFTDDYGNILGYRGMDKDITERKKAEEALRKAKENLEKQNIALKKLDKMKDGLIRDVTHELKTPVAKHKMHMELLKEFLANRSLSHEAGRILDVMDSSISRQESVIRNILDLTRLESGGRKYRSEPVRLDKVIDSILKEYQFTFDSSNMRVEKELNTVMVTSDREMLTLVFLNLISNAVKFRKSGTPSVLRISCKPSDAGGGVVTVADNGIGMTQEEMEKAFDPFFQGTPASEGSGVGLSIAKIIVDDLGGEITIGSRGPATGITVSVTLPYETG